MCKDFVWEWGKERQGSEGLCSISKSGVAVLPSKRTRRIPEIKTETKQTSVETKKEEKIDKKTEEPLTLEKEVTE